MANLEFMKENHNENYIKAMQYDDFLYTHSVIEKNDIKKIDKLMNITELADYWDKVRELTKRVYNDHSIHRWECLAEMREAQLQYQKELKGI